MHLGHHIKDAHIRQSTFWSIDFVKNKTKIIKRKIYKPAPTTIRPCRMLGATSFFHLRLRSSQFLLFFLWNGGKTEKIPRFGGSKST